jgi:PASTA domain-containing protein
MTARGRGRSFVRALGVATATAAFAAGSAQAATVNIGSSLTGSFSGTVIALSPITVVNTGVDPPGVVASPTDGTVISWKFVGKGPLTPRVIHPLGGGLYVGAGTGTSTLGAGNSQLSGPFAANLPIRKGDLFGWDYDQNGSYNGHNTPNGSRIGWTPPLADGGAGRAQSGGDPGEGLVQATVRYCLVPKVKGKTPKAAKNALRAADCTVGKVKKSKKTTKKKKVIKQSFAPGSSISDTQPVDLKVSRKAS